MNVVFAGTFSPDFDDDDFDEDFASMLGGSRVNDNTNTNNTNAETPSNGPLGNVDESGISLGISGTYEMEEKDDDDEFNFDTDF
jgi:hypothetical protein